MISPDCNKDKQDSMRYTHDGLEKWANVIVSMVISELKE